MVKVWDRRSSSTSPVGCLAGHKDGITFIDPRVWLGRREWGGGRRGREGMVGRGRDGMGGEDGIGMEGTRWTSIRTCRPALYTFVPHTFTQRLYTQHATTHITHHTHTHTHMHTHTHTAQGDGYHLISNSKDQSIKLWDMRHLSPQEGLEATRCKVAHQQWDYRLHAVPKPGEDGAGEVGKGGGGGISV